MVIGFKKGIAATLCVILILSMAPLSGFVGLSFPQIDLPSFQSMFASTAQAISGTCGTELTWDYNESTKVLTISGSGNINDYTSEEYIGQRVTTAPWKPYFQTMKTLVIEPGVTGIGVSAFDGCSGLTDVTIPESVTALGNRSFCGCTGIRSLIIPDSVTDIGNSVFSGCTGLTEIDLPNNMTAIGTSMFSGCSRLRSTDIPNGVTRIGFGAFSSCSKLSDITIPQSVTSIGMLAFSGCYYLDSITIPNSVTRIEMDAFSHVLNVVYHGTASGAPWGANGVNGYVEGPFVYDSPAKYRLFGCSQKAHGVVSIPDSVREISDHAFSKIDDLTGIVFPDGLTSIDCCVVYLCSDLEFVHIPSSVVSIGNEAIHTSLLSSLDICSDTYDCAARAYASDDHYHFRVCSGHRSDYYHKVSYNYSNNGGTSASKLTQDVLTNTAIDLTPTAYKSGWEFVGWNTNPSAETKLTSLTMGNEDIVLYAIYRKVITAAFIDYNGTSRVSRTVSATIFNNKTSASLTPPAQNNYKDWMKRGWSQSTVPSAEPTSVFNISVNTTFYGLYLKRLTLSYNTGSENTITLPPQSGMQFVNSYDISRTQDPSIILASGININGQKVSGWATTSNTGGVVYDPGDTITIFQDTIMYARWEANYGVVSYDYSHNGGTNSSKMTDAVMIGCPADLSPTAYKNGWQFIGWNTDPNATTALTSLTVNGNVVLYAVFKKTFTVNFIDYGGVSKVSRNVPVTLFNNESSAVLTPPAQNSYNGWQAIGWTRSTAPSASGTADYSVSDSTTYYGLYRRELTLSYQTLCDTPVNLPAQCGPQFVNSYDISHTQDPSFVLAEGPQRNGYRFIAWSKCSLNGTRHDGGSTISINKDMTMFAVWESNSTVISDAPSGVSVVLDPGDFTADNSELELVVETIGKDDERYASFKAYAGDDDVFGLFGIHMEKNGVKIQPVGMVTVRIPVPAGLDIASPFYVYHLKDDGSDEIISLKKGNMRLTDDRLFIECDISSFSEFAVCVETPKITVPVTFVRAKCEPVQVNVTLPVSRFNISQASGRDVAIANLKADDSVIVNALNEAGLDGYEAVSEDGRIYFIAYSENGEWVANEAEINIDLTQSVKHSRWLDIIEGLKTLLLRLLMMLLGNL